MLRKFRMSMPLLLFVAAVPFLACGGGGDEADPLDRELDLAMADDSLAALADTAMGRESQAETPAPTPPRRDPPPATRPNRTEPRPDPKPAEPAFREVSVSAGTLIRVSLDEELEHQDQQRG